MIEHHPEHPGTYYRLVQAYNHQGKEVTGKDAEKYPDELKEVLDQKLGGDVSEKAFVDKMTGINTFESRYFAVKCLINVHGKSNSDDNIISLAKEAFQSGPKLNQLSLAEKLVKRVGGNENITALAKEKFPMAKTF